MTSSLSQYTTLEETRDPMGTSFMSHKLQLSIQKAFILVKFKRNQSTIHTSGRQKVNTVPIKSSLPYLIQFIGREILLRQGGRESEREDGREYGITETEMSCS